MPANFNWQADDDSNWDEFAQSQEPKQPKKRPSFKIILLLISGLIVVIAALFVSRQIRNYVADTETSVEIDILTSQDLVMQAVDSGDPEVLVSVLSGREPEWTSALLSLLDKDLLYDRRQFGLAWQKDVPPVDVDIAMSPDLHKAEVQFTLTYAIESDLAPLEQIELKQVAIYRTSDDRWLLAPPLDDFWGDRVIANGRYVTVEFPQRDAELGRRLAADLEVALGSACNNLAGLDCPEDYNLEVVLTTDPQVLAEIANPAAVYLDGENLQLPTPTLMGTPVDEDAYRAIKRAYVVQAVSRLINELTGWSCCDQALFYRAIVDLQLAQLGMIPWPTNPGDYFQSLREPLSLDRIVPVWNSPQPIEALHEIPERWLVYAFIEFMATERVGTSSVDMQRALATSSVFFEWLQKINRMEYAPEYLNTSWNEFIRQRIASWQPDPPNKWPEQDIAMICDEGVIGASNLFLYDLNDKSWSLALAHREFVYMGALPDGNGIFFTEQLFRPDRLQTLIWQDDSEIVVDEGHRVYRLSGREDSLGRYAGLSGYDSLTISVGQYVLDINDCDSLNCSLASVPGSLRWSPDGQQSIYVESSQGQSIYVGDHLGGSPVRVGEGRNPFWISDETYGYLQGRVQPVVVTATIGIDEIHPLLDSANVCNLIPDANPEDIVLMRVAVQPVPPNKIIVTAVNRAGNRLYLVVHDWRSDSSTLVYESAVSARGLANVSFSPNGRWLLIRNPVESTNELIPQYEVLLHDLATDETHQLMAGNATVSPTLGWSADSGWLFQLGNGFLILTSPEDMYQFLVLHGLNDCRGAAWTSEQ